MNRCFAAAVAAAHPTACLPPNLPMPPSRGRLIILAAGKAAGSMTEVAESYYVPRMPIERLAGLAVTRHGYGRPTRHIPVIEAGHPVPDKAGISATKRVLSLADAVDGEDLVLVLLSGGASANWIAPATGLTLEEKQAVTRALLKSGAAIGEINTVRKHLSRIKGGRLAKRAHPAKVVTLAISDVPGDDPAVIGSGPTVPDPTTLADARDDRRAVTGWSFPGPSRASSTIPATRRRSRATRPSRPRTIGSSRDPPTRCRRRRNGPPRQVTSASRSAAACRAKRAKSPPNTRSWRANSASQGRRVAILSGGELTVTLRGKRPGRPEPGIRTGAGLTS